MVIVNIHWHFERSYCFYYQRLSFESNKRDIWLLYLEDGRSTSW